MLIAGVDEVGRGPLAGPVVAAAVVLHPQQEIAGVKDSKALSEKKREALAIVIKEQALAWAIGRAEVEEIDAINILQASLLAMQRAVAQLSVVPELVQVDGKHCPQLPCKTQAIVKGDALIPAIGAASIIAKVTRDAELIALDAQYPQYGFKQHKGYPTKVHLAALATHGVTQYHRKSFAPVRMQLEREALT